MTMNTLFNFSCVKNLLFNIGKFVGVVAIASFVGTCLGLLIVWAASPKENLPPPQHLYKGGLVFTEKTISPKHGVAVLFCTPRGMLVEVNNAKTRFTANVFDRDTGKPIFCDPATGKVFESK